MTNAGQITIGDAAGPAAAIVAINDDNTVSNLAGATITVGLNAAGILMQGNRAIVNNAGTINVGASGAAIDVFGDDAMVTSNGVINIGDNARRHLGAGRPRPDHAFRHHQWRRRKRRRRL